MSNKCVFMANHVYINIMKFLFFKVTGKKNSVRNASVNVERILFNISILLFILMIIIQAILTNPQARDYLNVTGTFEGKPLAIEEYLYKQGQIMLEASGNYQPDMLKALVNGEEAAGFNGKYLELMLKDGDVVEVDGSMLKSPVEIRIVSKTDNILTDCVGKTVRTQSDIKKLVKVKVE